MTAGGTRPGATSAAAPSVESPASAFAAALFAALIVRGVTDVVVCPGSRSQALALAAAAGERDGLLRVHVRTDERSAAFFALGIARETGVPAPVVVTSGSAVANLLPAVTEAHAGRVPLMLLTADRPPELHGIRANQTMHQEGVFDRFTRFGADLDADAFGADALDTDALDTDAFGADAFDAPPLDAAAPGALSAVVARAFAAATGTHANFRPPGERVTSVPGAHEATVLPPGPVHLNLRFREPLSGPATSVSERLAGADPVREHPAEPSAADPDPGRPPAGDSGATFALDDDRLTVVLAGAGAGDAARDFARDAGIPLLAEVVSGARSGREAIMGYQTLLEDDDLAPLIERVVVFGHPTLTRQTARLLRSREVHRVIVDPYANHPGTEVLTGHPDTTRATQADTSRHVVTHAYVVDPPSQQRENHRWLGAWIVRDRALRTERSTLHEPDLDAALAPGYKAMSEYARHEVAVKREAISRELLVDAVWRASWPHDRLVVAASRLVRVLDRVAQPRRVRIYANRGLGGIDGTLGTALGIASAQQAADDPALAAGATRVITGDLAFLHDVTSLQLTPGEDPPRIHVFVGNDRGGTIFDDLEVRDTAPESDFTRVLTTPHTVNLEALATAYGWAYERITTRGDLERLLTTPVTEPKVVEVPLGEHAVSETPR